MIVTLIQGILETRPNFIAAAAGVCTLTAATLLLLMRNLDIADSRAKLEMYASQPLDQGQVLVENGTLFGEIEPGGASRIAANTELGDDRGDEALDAAAMEFGTD
mgnify:CR=1 FL=1